MKGFKFSSISLLSSVLLICLTVKTNYDIAAYYKNADGKGRALFGIFEHLFDYKYYYLLFGLLSIILIFVGKKRNEQTGILLTSLILALLSIGTVFIRFWKYMI